MSPRGRPPGPGGSARIGGPGGSARIGGPGGSARIGGPGGSARIGGPGGSARIGGPGGSARIGGPGGSARIGGPGGSARIGGPEGSARIGGPEGSARIGGPEGSARIGGPEGSARIGGPEGSARIGGPEGSARIGGPEVATAMAAMAGLADVEGTILVVCDFDGTLAAIDPDPAGTALHPESRRALRRLGRIARGRPDRLALAILSGRTALDVAGRVRIGGVSYLGDHGLQGAELPTRVAAERMRVAHEPRHAAHAEASRRLGDDVGRLLADAEWLFVERKGPSVAFHYRTADEPAAARSRILAALGAAQGALPPHLREARFARHETWRIVEVRPEDAGMKGEAVTHLMRRHRAAAVAVLGDDRSDAAAFRVVTAARAAGRLAAALAVGVRRAGTHPEVVAAADVLLPGPETTGRLLRALARRLEAEERSAP